MIYLDNAATSFPKPREVIRETERCLRRYGGNPGRGSHRLALAAAEKIYECRAEAAELFGSSCPENVIFTLNTTAALNTVIKGLLKKGDHVLISDLEHNAVWRPVSRLAEEGRVTFDVFPSFATDPERSPEQICAAIEALIRPETKLLVCVHASNICSAVMPIAQIGALCRRHGVFFVVDAAQSAGHLPIRMEQMQIDALCVPGHKGLLGPQGSGILLLRDGILPETLIEGGSGTYSLEARMPEEIPERYEAGTLPTPAIAGLCEGIRKIRRVGLERIAAHERRLNERLAGLLSEMQDVRVYLPHLSGSVLLFSADRMPADRLGRELDARGFCVRAGFHCAALAHRTLGTPASGAVRVSPGLDTTEGAITAFAAALREILARGTEE